MGENTNSCCGINLPILEAELENEKHVIYCEMVKLYPEQNAEARFLKRSKGIIYAYCNKDGLIKKKI